MAVFDIDGGRILGSSPTLAYEIGLLDIDQSTVAGNMQVVEEVRELLDLPEEMFESRKTGIAGDLLSFEAKKSL
ncbi:hypothetical protein BGX33_000998 [Mortierella sp. NVP41]|nr:hypothetical protein BGX33_000998 [Mortierella sp. NVP41]